MDENTRRIASLNDAFRKTGQGGLINKTQGIAALPVKDQIQILGLVQSFNAFSEDIPPCVFISCSAIKKPDVQSGRLS